MTRSSTNPAAAPRSAASTPGGIDLVSVIDPQTIMLASAAQPLQTPTSFNPSTTVSSNTINLKGFSDGEVVTYNAPAPLEVDAQEDISNSTINLGTDSKGNPIPDNFTRERGGGL